MPRSSRSPQHRGLIKILTTRRNEAGLTQDDVARVLKRPQSFVSKYESGERRLDVIEFIEVAQALGADPTEVLKELVAVDSAK